MTQQCVTLSRHVNSCPIAAGFLNRWLMSRGDEASGTGASLYFNEAERLDPRNVHLLTQHARSYIVLRRFPEALRKLDQVLNITPDDVDTLALKASYRTSRGRSAACCCTTRSAASERRRPQRVGNTSLPSDPGAPPCTESSLG